MIPKTEKDLWIEMSIREISTQAHFAELAFQNIYPKIMTNNDGAFSSIHSFLSHSANVSKMLKAIDKRPSGNLIGKIIDKLFTIVRLRNLPITIGKILGISDSSIIHNRKFRNHLEHYDERLKQWIRERGVNVSIGTYNIGPKSAIQIPNFIYISHYDPSNYTFTFVDKDFRLDILHREVQRIKDIADKWVNEIQAGIIKPPFT